MNVSTSKRNNNRRHPGARGKRPDLKKLRQQEATERLEGWQSLSYEDQLKSLDSRLGKDVGAKQQRARLKALIDSGETHVKSKKKPKK